MKNGILFVASGPSGAGKTTLCRMVEERLKIPHSVSYTTRPPRKGEVQGKDYHFVSEAVFDQKVAEHAFLEWAYVHGYRYGTALQPIEDAKKRGQDLILDLDTQGALAVQKKDSKAILIFIDTPDSLLKERLGKRGTEDPEKMQKRLQKANDERQKKDHYPYILINEDLEKTYQNLIAVIEKERTR